MTLEETRAEVERLAGKRHHFLKLAFNAGFNWQDSEDLIHNCFFLAWAHADQYRGVASVYAWMRGILHYQITNKIRWKVYDRKVYISTTKILDTNTAREAYLAGHPEVWMKFVGQESKEIKKFETHSDFCKLFGTITSPRQRKAVKLYLREGKISDHTNSCLLSVALRAVRKRANVGKSKRKKAA